MADGTTFINIPQTGGAPEDYLVSGASSIDLLAARADFDGAGAGGDFLPALQIVDESGQVVATTFGSKVVAGDSASVTFAPFLGRGTATAPPGGGIEFDVVNSGDWLVVDTTDAGTNPSTAFESAGGFSVEDTSGGFSAISMIARDGGGMFLGADSPGTLTMDFDTIETPGTRLVDLEPTDTATLASGGQGITADNGTNTVTLFGGPGGAVKIRCDTATGSFGIQVSGNPSQKLAFFGATPVVQQVTPVTLGDVINLLRTFGLCS